MSCDTTVYIKNLKLEFPIMNAAGTLTLNEQTAWVKNYIGAYVTKSVTLEPRQGNPQRRITETTGGVLNSIGLQNNGIDYFMDHELPELQKYKIPIIISLADVSHNGFNNLFNKISNHKNYKLFSGVEINVSCPNAENGFLFGTTETNIKNVVLSAKVYFEDKIKIIKLTPNVTNLPTMARVAIDWGADVVTLINTVRGCAVDIENKNFILGNKIGGLSGPAIKPIGLLSVYECFTKIKYFRDKSKSIIGVGGILNYKDVLEYIMVGAKVVQIGSGFFSNPHIYKEIIEGLEEYLHRANEHISSFVGIVV